MSAIFSKFLPQSLTTRLFTAFMILSTLSLGGLRSAAYRDERNALTAQVKQQLTSVAELKEQQIETWLAERNADPRQLAVNRFNQDHLTAILDPRTSRPIKLKFIDFLTDNLLGKS